jgi:ankyrin repeat protein
VALSVCQNRDSGSRQKNRITLIQTRTYTGRGIEKGKEKNIMEYKNMMLAESRNGNTEAVKQLLEAGTDVNAKNNLGDTPLMWAARYGHTETVKLLLESSADVNAHNNYGWTALMWAARYGHTETIKFLLEKGADVNRENRHGNTALLFAAHEGSTEMMKLLLEAGADVNATNGEDASVLSYAYELKDEAKREEIIKMCREYALDNAVELAGGEISD